LPFSLKLNKAVCGKESEMQEFKFLSESMVRSGTTTTNSIQRSFEDWAYLVAVDFGRCQDKARRASTNVACSFVA
jgi:hypothetical protein